MKNFDHVQIVEPVTISGSYKATDGQWYDVQVVSPGITKITGLTVFDKATAVYHQQAEEEYQAYLLSIDPNHHKLA